jgi:hypothetical protein
MVLGSVSRYAATHGRLKGLDWHKDHGPWSWA